MTIINYDFIEDTTLTAGTYVFCWTPANDVPTVRPGVTLTIKDGAILTFGVGYVPGTQYVATEAFKVQGSVVATGAKFTNFNEGRSWGNIVFDPNSYGSFTDCIIENAGAGAVTYGALQTNVYTTADNVAIEFNGGEIRNSVTGAAFFYCQNHGSIKFDGTRISNCDFVLQSERSSKGVDTVFNNCTIENIVAYGILTAGGNLTVTGCTFRNIGQSDIITGMWEYPDNITIKNNTFNGAGLYKFPMRLYGSCNINKDAGEPNNIFINFPQSYAVAIIDCAYGIKENKHVYWGDIGTRYSVLGSGPIGTVNFTSSLTVGPGVTIATRESSFYYMGDFSALGTLEKPVTFTNDHVEPHYFSFGKGHLLFEHCIFDKVIHGIFIEDETSEDISAKVSLTVTNSVFKNIYDRGILIRSGNNYNKDNVLIENSLFTNNWYAMMFDGSYRLSTWSSGRVVACSFLNNTHFAAKLSFRAELYFENCTFSGNGTTNGWAIDCNDYNSCKVHLKNCIVWDNSLPAADYPSTFTIDYSCIQASNSDFLRITGSNNINLDPRFEGSEFPSDIYVDASVGSSGDGSALYPFKTIAEPIRAYQDNFSYALVTGSPCIGTGENGVNMGAPNGIAPSQKTTGVNIHLSEGEYDITGLSLFHHISVTGESKDTTKLKGSVFGLETGAHLEKVKVSDNNLWGILIPAYESPVIEDCLITNNSTPPGYNGTGINIYYGGSPYIKNCIISQNRGTQWAYVMSYGGGIYAGEKTSPTITDCIINYNISDGGNGIHSYRASYLTLKNCVVAYSYYEGICINESTALIENCTISKSMWAGISNNSSTVIVHNCIVYDNCTRWGNPAFENIRSNPAFITVSYSDVQGGYAGVGNIGDDPQFADPINEDFHLKSEGGRWDPQTNGWVMDTVTSPCIDAGDPTSDYSKEPQPNGARINMGSYGNTVYASKSQAAVDLKISKAGPPSSVYLGNNIVYTITVTNAGPSTATGVKMEDTVPGNVDFVSAESTKGDCYLSNGKVICDIGELSSGGLVSITTTFAPKLDGLVTNTATVSGNEYDTDPSNNSVMVATMVLPVTDLSIVISDSPDPVRVDEKLTYTITVQNNGPSMATVVKVKDTLPGAVSFVSAASTKGTCSQSGGIVTSDVGYLNKNESAVITIEVTPQTAGIITNTATVFGNEYDPVSTNNSVSENTTIDPPPTPQEQILELTFEVNDLVSEGKLGRGQGNSLIAKLNNAMYQLNKGNTNAAKNQLNAFINQVNDFIATGVISYQDGKMLIDEAIEIRDSL